MRERALAIALVLFVWPAGQNAAESSGRTTLLLVVRPESNLNPQQVPLQFRVAADARSGVTTQAATVVAQARALPGARIRVMARLIHLQGPAGPVDANALRWTGEAVGGSGGGQQAACSSGAFGSGAAQDLVEGWQRSGTLTCLVNFQLARDDGLPPGLYTGAVSLAIVMQ